MVAIAQLVEHLIVVQKVARSSRVSHPKETSLRGGFLYSSMMSVRHEHYLLSWHCVLWKVVCADSAPYVTGVLVGISRISFGLRAAMRFVKE